MGLVCLLFASSGLAGCIGAVMPILSLENRTEQDHGVHITLRKVSDGQPGQVVFERTVLLAAGDGQDTRVDLHGVHNVTVEAAGQRRTADMDFWSGSFLGGQMYAGIEIDDSGLVLSEYHAD